MVFIISVYYAGILVELIPVYDKGVGWNRLGVQTQYAPFSSLSLEVAVSP
jgi:hypothetical protein